MPGPNNALKTALAADRVLRGLWLASGSETVTEIAGRAGFDWCLIDGEHAPFDPTLIRRQLVTLAATGTSAVVRAPCAEDWVLKQLLDIGAQSVMVPMIDTADQARDVVCACRYPPHGCRGMGGVTTRAGGYGGWPDYPSWANDQIAVIVQVETRTALENIDAITAVDGVDCVFIGPADLSSDMGYRDDILAQPVWDAIEDAVRAIRAAGKAAGIIGPPEKMQDMVAAGVTFLGLDGDTGVMTRAFNDLAEGRA